MIKVIEKSINRRKLQLFFLAFIIPIVIILIGYKRMGIYPFGDASLLSMDLWGQYFPMLVGQYSNRQQFISSFFSWNGSLGFNNYAQSAYYCNSIFNYFLLLFSRKNLINALDLLILLKFGFCSLTFFIFLDYKYKKSNIITVACSVAYSLCAYTIAYMNQTMWFDAVIYFPIIIIGIEKMFYEKKPLLYCAFLALTIYSSFYISFSICLFLVVYFIVLIIINSKKLKHKEIKEAALYFIIFSLLAAGLAAFVVIPVFKAVQLTIASSAGIPNKLVLYNTLAEYIAKLLPLTKLSMEFGIPNIYSGSFILIMIPLYIANNEISSKDKIVFLSLIAYLYFTMNLNLLNYIWHGFHFPNQLPGRWTFIFSFVLIMLSYETLINIQGINLKGVIVSLFNVVFILSLLKVLPLDSRVGDKVIDCTIISMFIYALIMVYFILNKNKDIQKIIIAALAVCIMIDIGGNAIILLKRDIKTSSIKTFQHADEAMSIIVPQYESSRDDFYRMEMYEGWTFNPGQLYGYKGMSYYSSTMTASAYNFFKNMGYKVYANNVSTVYNPYSPVLNSLFSMKYLVDRNNNLNLIGFEKKDIINNYGVLENKYYLPFGFIVNKKLLDYKVSEGKPIDNQNNFFNAVMGKEVNVFEPIKSTSVNVTNANITYEKDWNNQYYNRIDKGKPVELTFTYKSDKDQLLCFQQNFRKGDMAVKINDIEQKININNDKCKYLGFVKTGDNIKISLIVNDVDIGIWGLDFFSFNLEKFTECYNELKANTVKNIKFSNTKIKCNINAGKEGLLYTSIPNDNGWTVKCDGTNIQTFRISDYFLGIIIPEGEHVLEFSYHVPGLLAGSIISFISLCLIITYILLKKKVFIILKTDRKCNKTTGEKVIETEQSIVENMK